MKLIYKFVDADCSHLLNKEYENYEYRKVASSNTSCLEARAGFFQIAYEGDFQSLCTTTF